MTSKQEKLAAARKKLKEFQGRHRESESLKQIIMPEKNIPIQPSPNFSNLSIQSSPIHSLNNTDLNNENLDKEYPTQKFDSDNLLKQVQYFENNEADQFLDLPNKSSNSLAPRTSESEIINPILVKVNVTLTDKIIPEESHLVESSNSLNQPSQNSLTETNSNNVLRQYSPDTQPYQFENKKPYHNTSLTISESITAGAEYTEKKITYLKNINSEADISLCQNESKDLSGSGLALPNVLNEAIKPLQSELQNQAQTINILIEQRNEAQIALAHAQNALSEKSDKLSQQRQQILSLTAAVNDLSKRLADADLDAKNLGLENEKKLQQINETFLSIQTLKSQLEAKDEEYLEMKMKYEEKNKECQILLHNLNETQSQLSLCQIEIQKHIHPVSDEYSNLMLRVSNLENENAILQQKLEYLKQELEVAITEKERSSQNFKAYSQQCNAELEALNSQIKVLTISNEKLKEINKVDPTTTPEEVVPNIGEVNTKDYKNEVISLHQQINDLTEIKNQVLQQCHELEEENDVVKTRLEEKETQFKNLMELMQDLEKENKKLQYEVDSSKGNGRLLAAIESDKVAAAKAVAQNQKLKNQIIELEEAFVKLNEEKLELTNQLSHEKHLNKGLNNRLETMALHYDENNYKDDYHKDNYNSDDKTTSIFIEQCNNNSEEVDELKRIIRQLQDDKMELKSRMNSYILDLNEKNHGKENNEDENQENAKLRLQQMEEKVRKTMNEIALLDEEKEKLEHLVLQLQGETETIGEYITLYQKQRMLLKQRSQEKDNQLIQLSKDKEELKTKLNNLDKLVQHLLKEKNDLKFVEDGTSLLSKSGQSEETESTAIKIRALIDEIGSSNLISNPSIAFKHCSYCSGRLINV